MHKSDKKIGRRITGRVKWSPEYKRDIDLVEIWTIIHTRHKENYYNVRRITQLLRKFLQTPDTIDS